MLLRHLREESKHQQQRVKTIITSMRSLPLSHLLRLQTLPILLRVQTKTEKTEEAPSSHIKRERALNSRVEE